MQTVEDPPTDSHPRRSAWIVVGVVMLVIAGDIVAVALGLLAGSAMTAWKGTDLCKLGTRASWLAAFVAWRRAPDLPIGFLRAIRIPLAFWLVGGVVLMSPVLGAAYRTRASGYGSLMPSLAIYLAGMVVLLRAFWRGSPGPTPIGLYELLDRTLGRPGIRVIAAYVALPLVLGIALAQWPRSRRLALPSTGSAFDELLANLLRGETAIGILGLAVISAGVAWSFWIPGRAAAALRGGLATYKVVVALLSLLLCTAGSLLYTLRFPELGYRYLEPRWPVGAAMALLVYFVAWTIWTALVRKRR